MPKPPIVKTRQVVAAFERAGFTVVKSEGSRAKLRHRDGRIAMVVEYGQRDYPLGTRRETLRQAGLTVDEFRRLLKD